MNKADSIALVLTKALAHVPFDGWTVGLLERACEEAGLGKGAWFRLFPLGPIDAVDAFARSADRAMLQSLAKLPLSQMKIRERIASAVHARLTYLLPHREAVRRAVSFCLLPPYVPRGMKMLGRTVDDIWHAAGDTSTDFNFYTKRLMLAAVYSSTLQCWLNDESEGQQDSWAFLDRRIENVMQFERLKKKVMS